MSVESEIIRLRPEVSWREIEGEIIVLDPQSWQYMGINLSGATVWPLIVEGCSHEEIVEKLLETFEIDEERASADATAFVDVLRGHDLLEGPDAAP